MHRAEVAGRIARIGSELSVAATGDERIRRRLGHVTDGLRDLTLLREEAVSHLLAIITTLPGDDPAREALLHAVVDLVSLDADAGSHRLSA